MLAVIHQTDNLRAETSVQNPKLWKAGQSSFGNCQAAVCIYLVINHIKVKAPKTPATYLCQYCGYNTAIFRWTVAQNNVL